MMLEAEAEIWFSLKYWDHMKVWSNILPRFCLVYAALDSIFIGLFTVPNKRAIREAFATQPAGLWIRKMSDNRDCFSNVSNAGTKDPLFPQPMRLWLAHKWQWVTSGKTEQLDDLSTRTSNGRRETESALAPVTCLLRMCYVRECKTASPLDLSLLFSLLLQFPDLWLL